jgi:hypothetical protein
MSASKKETTKETLEQLKTRLENEALTQLQLGNQNPVTIMKRGEEEFVKLTRRYMTYAEIREMYG